MINNSLLSLCLSITTQFIFNIKCDCNVNYNLRIRNSTNNYHENIFSGIPPFTEQAYWVPQNDINIRLQNKNKLNKGDIIERTRDAACRVAGAIAIKEIGFSV